MEHLPIDRILRLPEVINYTGLSRSTIYSYMKNGRFPYACEMGGMRAIGWKESAILKWIGERQTKGGDSK